MTDLLHRMGFVYKKLKVIPGKVNAEAQEQFIKDYAEIKENKGKKDPVYLWMIRILGIIQWHHMAGFDAES